MAWMMEILMRLGAFDFVVFHVSAYHGDEFVAVAFGLSGAYAGDVLELVDGDGIGGCHCFERGVLEYHIWREVMFFRHLLAEVLEYGV